MNSQLRRKNASGMTFIEILVVLVVLVILAGLLFPCSGSGRAKAKARRIACVNNLKQIGLALRMWSNESEEKFPWAASLTNVNGNTVEFAESAETWRHFKILSNELSSPKVLACSMDNRPRASAWEEVTSNKHLSYFVGLDADETRPQTILSGDRNLKSTVKPANGILRLTADTPVEWMDTIHKRQGNLGLGDGSVQQTTTSSLCKQIESVLSTDTNRLVIRLALPE